MKIPAMTKSQRDLKAWVEDQTIPVMETLAQLYLFKETEYINHWWQEVWAKFYRIAKTKSKSAGLQKNSYSTAARG